MLLNDETIQCSFVIDLLKAVPDGTIWLFDDVWPELKDHFPVAFEKIVKNATKVPQSPFAAYGSNFIIPLNKDNKQELQSIFSDRVAIISYLGSSFYMYFQEKWLLIMHDSFTSVSLDVSLAPSLAGKYGEAVSFDDLGKVPWE